MTHEVRQVTHEVRQVTHEVRQVTHEVRQVNLSAWALSSFSVLSQHARARA